MGATVVDPRRSKPYLLILTWSHLAALLSYGINYLIRLSVSSLFLKKFEFLKYIYFIPLYLINQH